MSHPNMLVSDLVFIAFAIMPPALAAGASAHKPVASPTVAAASTAATTSAAATAAAAVGPASATGVRLPDGGGTPMTAAGAAVPATLRVLSYQPPPEELVEALTQLFRWAEQCTRTCILPVCAKCLLYLPQCCPRSWWRH
eukprot:1147659-Pelagomonas_calceolata.AAC.5